MFQTSEVDLTSFLVQVKYVDLKRDGNDCKDSLTVTALEEMDPDYKPVNVRLRTL